MSSRKDGRIAGGASGYLFLAPTLAVFILFNVIPALEIFLNSLRDASFVGEGGWTGWKNFIEVFRSETTLMALLNSLLYLLATPTVILLSLVLALVLDERLGGIRFYRSLFFLPVVTPMIVVGLMWRWILNEDVGLLNYLLLSAGIVNEKVSWLSTYPLNLISVMGVTVWRGLGYYSLIYLAALSGIPREMEEAARVEGASWSDLVLRIKLPMIRNVILLTVVLSSISALKAFDEIAVIIPNSPLSERTMVPLIYETAFIDFQLGPASVLSLSLFLLTFGFSFVITRRWGKD